MIMSKVLHFYGPSPNSIPESIKATAQDSDEKQYKENLDVHI